MQQIQRAQIPRLRALWLAVSGSKVEAEAVEAAAAGKLQEPHAAALRAMRARAAEQGGPIAERFADLALPAAPAPVEPVELADTEPSGSAAARDAAEAEASDWTEPEPDSEPAP